MSTDHEVYDCPHAEVCQTCPCSHEDDACFPGERLRAERDRADSAAAIFSDAASEWRRRAEAAEAAVERWKSQYERCIAHMTHDRARMRVAEQEANELRAHNAMMTENEQRMQEAGDRLAAALGQARHELESGPVAIPAVENALDIISAELASFGTP